VLAAAARQKVSTISYAQNCALHKTKEKQRKAAQSVKNVGILKHVSIFE
jgi:hypothetical protein